MVKVILGLFCVMVSNILFGVTLAKIKGMFNKDKLLKSFVKYISLILVVFFIYIAGVLNENVVVAKGIISNIKNMGITTYECWFT